MGSSPLARGLQGELLLRVEQVGIIPARAGFTPPAPPSQHSRRDHPRSRGVYANEEDRVKAAGGSSPLARGLLAALGTLVV